MQWQWANTEQQAQVRREKDGTFVFYLESETGERLEAAEVRVPQDAVFGLYRNLRGEFEV